jgi:hypothetical protein
MKEELKAVKHMLRVKAAEAEQARNHAEVWEREASQWRAAAEKGTPIPGHRSEQSVPLFYGGEPASVSTPLSFYPRCAPLASTRSPMM